MPTYKGNRGNLLQHWVLAELIQVLRDEVPLNTPLCFVDAHAMSPYAVRSDDSGQTAADFDAVAQRLPGQGTVYERSWAELSQDVRRVHYPSSALFVHHLWQGPAHLVLCKTDEEAAGEITEWQRTISGQISSELHIGDWRLRFRNDFHTGAAAYPISFDPYMFDRHGPPASPNPGNMWPSDVVRIRAAILELKAAPIILQLSTYSANNANAQTDVLACIESLFSVVGLQLGAQIRADGNMMSMVFTRDVAGVRDAHLQQRFTDWLEQARTMPA